MTVYEDLRARILKGAFAAGTWLREETLAADLGVSRTPVREALRRLQADGLVELTPNRGAQVVQFSESDIEATYDLRALLEGYGARCAAEGGRADVTRMRDLCRAMERRRSPRGDEAFDQITQLNLELHGEVHAAAGNVVLPGLLSGLVHLALVRHTFHHYTRPELDRSFAQHRELVDAIEAGDGNWASAVMAAHVLGARASLRRRMAGAAPVGRGA